MPEFEKISYQVRSNPYFLFPGFVKNPSVFISEKTETHGGFFRVNIPGIEIWAIADTDVLQHVLLRNESNYVKSRYYWNQLRVIVGDALGTLENDEWAVLKRLHAKALTRTKTSEYLAIVEKNIHSYLGALKGKVNSVVNIISVFSELNISILLQALFGYENRSICAMLVFLIGEGQKYLLWRSKYPWRPLLANLNGEDRKYKRSIRCFEILAKEVIDIRKTTYRDDIERLVDLLIEKSHFSDSEIFVKELRSELIIYLGAGSETAAVGLGWTMYLLAKNRDKLDKLRTEVFNVTGGKPVGLDHLGHLTYTDWVIKEGLRLYSPSHAIVRDALNDDNIKGTTIHKGATVFVSSFALHRNQAYWDAPLEFLPERFEIEPMKYSYIPFGAGKHTCIGRYLATPILVFTLAAIVQQFDFELAEQGTLIPQSGSTLKPDKPILLKLKTLH